MNPRRAPIARRPRAERAYVLALEDLRTAYRTLAPAPDLVARVGAAIRAPLRRRRRAVFAAVLSVVTAFVGGYVMRGGPLPLGLDDDVGRVTSAAHRGAAYGGASRDPAPGAATLGAAAYPGAVPRLAVVPPATARLAALVAGATALPRPDAATRHAWILATFDPDPRVREAATLLLALADEDAPAPDRRP